MPKKINDALNRLDFAGCAGGIEGLGPGKRAVMWVRGCPLACPGCMTPELWANGPSTDFWSIEQVAKTLNPLLTGADGLTISGGEPMNQPIALRNLVRLLRVDWPDLEVLVYSGYAIEELQNRGTEVAEFLSEIDILIDSPFDQEQANNLKWRGSDNQRIFYLSQRAQKYLQDSDEALVERPLHIQMMGDGQFRIIGIPRRGDMEQYRRLMEERGILVQKLKRRF